MHMCTCRHTTCTPHVHTTHTDTYAHTHKSHMRTHTFCHLVVRVMQCCIARVPLFYAKDNKTSTKLMLMLQDQHVAIISTVIYQTTTILLIPSSKLLDKASLVNLALFWEVSGYIFIKLVLQFCDRESP